MGFLDYFRRSTTSATGDVSAVSSPWSEGQLAAFVWSDVFGTEPTTLTRADALSIPAVNKGVGILKALIADKPLKAFRGAEPANVQPTWAYRTDGATGPWQRMAGTLDDLIFHGWSLWAVERGAANQITGAVRVPYARWEFGTDGRVLVRKTPSGPAESVDERSVVLIPGADEGLLAHAGRNLRGAASIERAWVDRARSPIPQIDLHQTVESNITTDEAKALVQEWEAARANGSTAFTPHDIEARALGQVSPDLFTEGRNNNRLDVANFLKLPAALLDGSVSTASLTYSTQEGHANEVFSYCLPYWVAPIEDRLSQDDVVPAGQRIRFDFSALLELPQSPTERGPIED